MIHRSEKHGPSAFTRDSTWMYAGITLLVAAVLFLSNNRTVSVYDEGIALTAAMRVVAGQVIHRDFYYNYGPANIYMLAGLFRLFGESVLVARMFALLQAATTATGIYILVRRLAGEGIALAALAGSLLWPGFLSWMTLGMLWATWIVAGGFERALKRSELFVAGILAGITFGFRYDVGLAVAGTGLMLLVAGDFARAVPARLWLRGLATALGVYAAGFLVLVIPIAAWYVACHVVHDTLFDIVLYPSKHYHASRNLPFPSIHRGNFEDVVVYLFPMLLAIGLYEAVYLAFRARRQAFDRLLLRWSGLLCSFTCVGILMYLKALVRIGSGTLFLCCANCLMLCAVLFASRAALSPVWRVLVGFIIVVFAVGGLSERRHSISYARQQGALMLGFVMAPSSQAPYGSLHQWCETKNAVSKGFCYFPDNDHIQLIEYIDAHTSSADTIYIGLPRHDRININDNVTYFAVQRMPATKWSHFDPFLQNSLPVQAEMIGELERNKPPYIVLDSEFDNDLEPNGSSVSTGVHVMDEYIQRHYAPAQSFGELTILRRKS